MDRFPVDDGAARARAAVEGNRSARIQGWNGPILSCEPELIAIEAAHHCIVCTTDARRSFRNCVEHRLQIGGRAGDYTQKLAGRSLLLQRLGEVLTCFGELAPRCFKLMFQIGTWLKHLTPCSPSFQL